MADWTLSKQEVGSLCRRGGDILRNTMMSWSAPNKASGPPGHRRLRHRLRRPARSTSRERERERGREGERWRFDSTGHCVPCLWCASLFLLHKNILNIGSAQNRFIIFTVNCFLASSTCSSTPLPHPPPPPPPPQPLHSPALPPYTLSLTAQCAPTATGKMKCGKTEI